MSPSVCVIVAAKDSSATIARAVQSALAEPEVARVIVVDDGSADDTAEVARAAGDGDSRLTVMQLDRNYGPSYARNRAIAASQEAYLAILDADDEFLPGRFAQLFEEGEWDMVADNIAFVGTPGAAEAVRSAGDGFDLDLAAFVAGNINRPGVWRGEYGFLKPMIRRAFLQQHGLAYDEALRLGEDYDLYARMLVFGARFRVTRSCGYAALVRANSLSGRHNTADLERLVAVDEALLGEGGLAEDARAALTAHLRQAREKHMLRRFLDVRRESGVVPALLWQARDRAGWWPVARGVLSDKTAPLRRRVELPPVGGIRYLLPLDGTTGAP